MKKEEITLKNTKAEILEALNEALKREKELEKIKYEPQKEEESIEEKQEIEEDLRSLTNEEITYICSNLAKACEKEYKEEEQSLFTELAKYFEGKTKEKTSSLEELKIENEKDRKELESAMKIADENSDRGAKRVLTWATKTSNMMKIILENLF